MSKLLQPSAQLVIPTVIDAPVRPSEGRVGLDASRVPYAQAEVTLPLTDADLGLVEGLDPRTTLRGMLTAGEAVAGTSRVFDLAVQSQRVSHDGRSMTVTLGGDETLLQQFYPLVEDRTPLTYQDSLRSVCNYVLSQAAPLRRNLFLNPWSVNNGVIQAAGEVTLSTVNGRLRVTHTNGATAGNDYLLHPLGVLRAGVAYGFKVELQDVSGALAVSAFLNVPSPWATLMTLTQQRLGNTIYLTGTYTPQAHLTEARVLIDFAGAGTGEGYTLALSICEEGATTAGPYFDGGWLPPGTVDGRRTMYEGAELASPSRMVPRLKASPGVDANATAYWSVTNLLTEPGHEGSLGWVAGTNATALGPATPARSGSVAARWTAPAAGVTWIDTAGPIRIQQGLTYTISTFMRAVVAIPGRFMVRFRNDAGVILQETYSPQKTLTSAYQRLVYSVTAPPGATQATLHIGAITTAANQQVWNDDAMFYLGAEEIAFFDGNTVADAYYTYAWSGAAQASTSTRTPVIERPLETFYWRPNTSAWEFLMALVGSFGYRLFCDEQRQWFLIDPNAYVVAGTVSVGTTAGNAVTGTTTIDRDDDAYCTGVSILWKWQDRWGIPQQRIETAGYAGNVKYLEFERPFPGGGLAAALLARAEGRGRVHDLSVLTDLTATPAMKCPVTFPGAPARRAQITAVEWNLKDALMRLTVRNGNRVPDAPAAPTVTSPAAGRLVVAWGAPDNGGRPILEYQITVADMSGTSGDTRPATGSPATLDGFTSGAVQRVSVSARNIYGWGPYSPAVTVTVS